MILANASVLRTVLLGLAAVAFTAACGDSPEDALTGRWEGALCRCIAPVWR